MKLSKNIDEDIDYVMNLIEGEIISVYGGEGPSSETSSGGVHVSKETYEYTITTDKENYILSLLYIGSDSFNRENEGLYMLKLIKEKDSEIGCITCPGIYVPPGIKYTDIKLQDGTEIPGGFKFLKYEEDHSDGEFNIKAIIQSEIAYGDIDVAIGFFNANGKKIGIASGRTKSPVEAGGTFEVNMKPRAYGNNELKYEDIASYKFFGINAR